jgi:hypothetical protein
MEDFNQQYLEFELFVGEGECYRWFSWAPIPEEKVARGCGAARVWSGLLLLVRSIVACVDQEVSCIPVC